MRQISPATNLVLACLAGLGLLGMLGTPWYAPKVPDKTITDGPVERGAFAIAHVFTHHNRSVTGLDALGATQTLLLGLVAAIVVLAVLEGVPALRAHVRDFLRAVAIAVPVIVFYLIWDRPGKLDIHWGVLAAFAVACFMANAAWHGSAIREKRVAPGTWERKPA
jgi:hypothetical protein